MAKDPIFLAWKRTKLAVGRRQWEGDGGEAVGLHQLWLVASTGIRWLR